MQRAVVAKDKLPKPFPTHLQSAEFWEKLGRTIATFGFLENTLARAIFAFTATREYSESEVDSALAELLSTLQKALSDPLGGLISSYETAVKNNSSATITNLDELVSDLRSASKIRNVLCHGFWSNPDLSGKCVPFFVNKQGE